ncbi:helix-turn-helix domain-containing protein [Paraburkholderia terrae]
MLENVQQEAPPLPHLGDGNGLPTRQVVSRPDTNGQLELLFTNPVGVIDSVAAPAVRKKILEDIRAESGGNGWRTQCARLLTALLRLGSVTTFEASRYLDIYHPPARKRDLIQQGYLITTRRRAERTECGNIHRVGEYRFASIQEDEAVG